MLVILQAFNKIYGKWEAVKFGQDIAEKKCSGLTQQVSNSRRFGENMMLMHLKHKNYLGFLFYIFLVDSLPFLWDIFFIYDQQNLREI